MALDELGGSVSARTGAVRREGGLAAVRAERVLLVEGVDGQGDPVGVEEELAAAKTRGIAPGPRVGDGPLGRPQLLHAVHEAGGVGGAPGVVELRAFAAEDPDFVRGGRNAAAGPEARGEAGQSRERVGAGQGDDLDVGEDALGFSRPLTREVRRTHDERPQRAWAEPDEGERDLALAHPHFP